MRSSSLKSSNTTTMCLPVVESPKMSGSPVEAAVIVRIVMAARMAMDHLFDVFRGYFAGTGDVRFVLIVPNDHIDIHRKSRAVTLLP